MVPLLQQYELYDLCVVMLGSNDLLEGADAGECANRMKHFLEGLPEKILLVAPVPFVQGQWISDPAQIKASEELGYEYRRVAETMHIPFADAGNWNVKLSYDGVHYLPEGHEAFAKGLAETLRHHRCCHCFYPSAGSLGRCSQGYRYVPQRKSECTHPRTH